MGPAAGPAVARLIIRVAALLVPAAVRHDWRLEWQAELAALDTLPVQYRRPVRRAMGAFADAFWLRQRSVADFDWIDDVRHGLRQLAHHVGFATSAIGILGLGLAAAITMFCVTDQVLLRPLPYSDPDRIVTLWETRAPNDEALEVAPANLLDWRARAQSFAHLAGVEPWSIDVAGDPRPEVWFAAKVTEGFFETFGVNPILGRLFTADEYQAGRDRVLVLGEAFWRQRFAGDPAIVGATIRADSQAYTVIGVVPASFEPRLLATGAGHRNVWLPKAIEDYEPKIRGSGYWAAVGRLNAGVSIESARAEMQAISKQLGVEHPRTNEPTGALVLPLRDHLVGDAARAVTLLAAAVGLVLVIACVNVAHLLLVRGLGREREMAIRTALGARRGRIVRQLLIESFVIAAAGGLVGAAAAEGALAAIAVLGPATLPWLDTLYLDWRAAGFAMLMVAAVALLSGLAPAWRSARVGLASAGRGTSTADVAQQKLRTGLVVAEVALALVLVSGAALLVRSFVGLMGVDPGFERDRVLVAQVFAWDYNPAPAQLRNFFDRTIARLAALPSVQHAGAVSAMPFIETNINIQNVIAIGGRPPVTEGEAPRAHLSVATPGYFETMRIPLKTGRHLEARDHADGKRVAVITDTLARRYWPRGDDPIGDTVRFRFSGTLTEVEIVGVVGSLRHDGLDRAMRDELFMPHAQMPFGSMTFVLRSAGDATAVAEPARAAIWAVNPSQPIYRTATLDELVHKTVSPRRFALAVTVAFAVVALLLAVAGIYGVLSAIMTSRLREVGLRLALGASRGDIVRLVLVRGLAMASGGLAIGLLGTLGAARLLRGFLFQITPADPVALVISATAMGAAVLLACSLPARRAASTDPMTLLRAE